MFIATAVASMVSFNYRLIYDVKGPPGVATEREVILYRKKKNKIQYLAILSGISRARLYYPPPLPLSRRIIKENGGGLYVCNWKFFQRHSREKEKEWRLYTGCCEERVAR